MYFQIKDIKNEHFDFGTCLASINQLQLITCSDDHYLIQWNLESLTPIKKLKLENNFYPTNLIVIKQLNLMTKDILKEKQQIKLVLSCTDGKFHFINFTLDKIEKSIEAHQGAVLSLQFNLDESAILTSGEDGQIKIWSKTGSLRYTIGIEKFPIFCALWSLDINERIIYSSDDQICIKPLTPNSKSIKWVAHKNKVIRSLDWNFKYKLLLSLDESSKIKLWDNLGNHLKTISNQERVNCITWSLNSEFFVCGGYNILQLGDHRGFLLFTQKLTEKKLFENNYLNKSINDKNNVENNLYNENIQLDNEIITLKNLIKVIWFLESNSIIAISSSGQLLYGYIVNTTLQWSSFILVLKNSNKLLLKNILNDFEQDLEFNEPILNFSLKFNYLIILCISKCFIYKLIQLNAIEIEYWNENFNPIIIKLNNLNFYLIMQSANLFCLISDSKIVLYNYQGRQLMILDESNLTKGRILKSSISLNDNCLALQNMFDTKRIKFYDLNFRQNKLQQNQIKYSNQTEFIHDEEIIDIKLNINICSQNELKCAFIDKNQNLYLTLVKPSLNCTLTTVKLLNICTSIEWNEQFNILACLNQNLLNIYIYPDAIFIDRELFHLSKIVKDFNLTCNQLDSQYLELTSFNKEQIKLRNQNGNFITSIISPFYLLLHEYFENKKYNFALKLCRLDLKKFTSNDFQFNNAQNSKLWSAFTAMALNSRNLKLIEEGYSNVELYERVLYIENIKNIFNKQSDKNLELMPINSKKLIQAEKIKNGELSLMCINGYREAEAYFLNAGLVLRTLFLHLNSFNWQDALSLCQKYDHLCSKKISKLLIQNSLLDEDDQQLDSILIRLVLTYHEQYFKSFNLNTNQDEKFKKLKDNFIFLEENILKYLDEQKYELCFDLK